MYKVAMEATPCETVHTLEVTSMQKSALPIPITMVIRRLIALNDIVIAAHHVAYKLDIELVQAWIQISSSNYILLA